MTVAPRPCVEGLIDFAMRGLVVEELISGGNCLRRENNGIASRDVILDPVDPGAVVSAAHGQSAVRHITTGRADVRARQIPRGTRFRLSRP